jgi:RNA polymerase sigma-70 factor (ECF subfamily)
MSESSVEDFSALFRREYPAIVHTAWLVLGDRDWAAEVAQEAFTRMFVNWRKVSRYDRPGAWARRVAIRIALRDRARAARLHAPAQEVPAAPVPVADVDLHAAIRSLPPQQRAAVVLHYLDGLPVEDVAKAIGCRPSTARVHLHRARHRLAELLGEDVEEVRDVAG